MAAEVDARWSVAMLLAVKKNGISQKEEDYCYLESDVALSFFWFRIDSCLANKADVMVVVVVVVIEMPTCRPIKARQRQRQH